MNSHGSGGLGHTCPATRGGCVASLSVVLRAGMAMGESARESVKERFLTIRLLEQYLDLLISFETVHGVP
jgi:hypothetical protein